LTPLNLGHLVAEFAAQCKKHSANTNNKTKLHCFDQVSVNSSHVTNWLFS